MKDRIGKYQETKRKIKFNEAVDRRMAQDLSRADDDGFAIARDDADARSTDSVRWSGLWQRIKAKSSRLFRYK